MLKKVVLICLLCGLTACVTVEPEKPLQIAGTVHFNSKLDLPNTSEAVIALVDLDNPGRVFETKRMKIYQQPILFQFYVDKNLISSEVNYGVVALIRTQQEVLLQSYQRYPVIQNKKHMVDIYLEPYVPL
jgi:putative lipoprotein